MAQWYILGQITALVTLQPTVVTLDSDSAEIQREPAVAMVAALWESGVELIPFVKVCI